MANFLPVVIALVVTIYNQTNVPFTSWLIIGDDLKNSNVISRMLILLSTFLLILDNNLMPDRYRMKIPPICALIIEYIETHIAMVLILYVWTQFQSMLCILLKELLLVESDPQHTIYYQLGGDIFLGYFTTAMSIITLWYSFKATGSKERFKNAMFTFCDFFADHLLKICECSDDENVENVKNDKCGTK